MGRRGLSQSERDSGFMKGLGFRFGWNMIVGILRKRRGFKGKERGGNLGKNLIWGFEEETRRRTDSAGRKKSGDDDSL